MQFLLAGVTEALSTAWLRRRLGGCLARGLPRYLFTSDITAPLQTMWASDKLGFVLAPTLIVIKNRALGGGSREQNNSSIVSFIRENRGREGWKQKASGGTGRRKTQGLGLACHAEGRGDQGQAWKVEKSDWLTGRNVVFSSSPGWHQRGIAASLHHRKGGRFGGQLSLQCDHCLHMKLAKTRGKPPLTSLVYTS